MEPNISAVIRAFNEAPIIGGRANMSQHLNAVLAAFRKAYHQPDERQLKVAIAAVVANMLPTDPVWVLFCNPPSAGKTEALRSLEGISFCHAPSTFTEASLLSGTPLKHRAKTSTGGLLRELGNFGIIVLKDFTSVLAMPRDPRASVLAALREIFDGRWTRMVGSDGGSKLSWAGKVGLLGAVTNAYDTHSAVIAAMGDRFLLYRSPVARDVSCARASHRLKMLGCESARRAEVSAAIDALVSSIKVPDALHPLPDADIERLSDLCTLVATARSAVDRDGRTREIELVHESEAPMRLAGQLGALWHGLIHIGIDGAEPWDIIRKVALDSMPPLRRRVLFTLFDKGALTTRSAAEILEHPTLTIRRALEDLTAHNVVQRVFSVGGKSSDSWRLHDWAWATLKASGQLGKADACQ